jgi:N-acetylglucosaminyl-diphospho-decaprenol L-rhamnosyltransferase
MTTTQPVAARSSGGTQPSAVPEVSVAIVHYQTPELLERCLQALRASNEADRLEVFVVDNASSRFDADACRRVFPGVQVIENTSNLGFAVASNQALRLATGRYLLLLNPDARVDPETMSVMRDYMDAHPDVGCATARVELPDGSLDLACRRLFPTPERSLYRMTMLSKAFPRSRRFGQYNLTYLDEWMETEIDQPCGAFMMVRSEIRDSIGLLDERYFMYGEDSDWAYRMKQAGWRIMYVPSTTVHHDKRAASRKYRSRTVGYFYDAMLLFYDTHYRPIYPRWVTAAVHAGVGIRRRVELTAERTRALLGRRAGP